MNIACIYAITNLANGSRYIGSTVNFRGRSLRHMRNLRQNAHPNAHLQSAWNLYGEQVFAFTILSATDRDNLIPYEQAWLDGYLPEYNMVKIAKRQPRGRWNVGRIVSPETCAKISAAKKGKSYFRPGYRHSPETIEKMRKSKIGKTPSEESRKRMSLSHIERAKTHPMSQDARRKVGAFHTGRKRPPITGKKISDSKKRPVINLITEEVFDSKTEAAETIGIHRETLCRRINREALSPDAQWAFLDWLIYP